MTVLQKWLAIIGGLSALYIVAANPVGISSALGAGQRFISGTDKTAMGR
jgi:hypothetical protein